MKNRLDLDNEALARIFEDWNTGELDSYLIGITADILRFKDEAGEGYLLDKILDAAGQFFQTSAHNGHAVQKQRNSTQQRGNVCDIHNDTPKNDLPC